MVRKPTLSSEENVTVKSYLKNNSNIRMKRYIPCAYIFSKKISWKTFRNLEKVWAFFVFVNYLVILPIEVRILV